MASDISTLLDWLGFTVLTLLTLGSGIMVLMAHRLVHAALWLAGVLVGVAGFFLFIGSEFLAGVQLLIYVGAILTLILFSIMFTTEEEEAEEAVRRGRDEEGSS